ncbi:hypothetical protein F0562_002718 [Nyssa sinensis]|uniref:Protein kinase domain-containing protein n=1 Tax=Nyssa sinensis TaxID=561372 RepID=A0A5J5BTW0_9ASTE|nr:hypothetical protein F0562_002718 [Nyssa sinensis]
MTYRATIDADGIFRLYSHGLDGKGNWTIEWSSSNDCEPRNFCGPNAYNNVADQEPECVCLPGFEFINLDQRSLGCKRSFSADGCLGKNENVTYHRTVLRDCNCEAALYIDDECKKQKVPLKFGKRQDDDSTVTLVKVGIGGSTDRSYNPIAPDRVTKDSKKQMDILITDFLFKSETQPNWNERIRIVLDIARGILYLHEECDNRIIHCDINSNNILLDEYHCAKISDFGLAKLLKLEQTRTMTGIRGTRGYVAPEWHRNLPITVKADVYSFGIGLLEVICCRKCVDMTVQEDEAVLADWVYNCFQERELRKLAREEEVDEQQLERMVRIGLLCIHYELSVRPSMKNVILMLEGIVEIPETPGPSSFSSVPSS